LDDRSFHEASTTFAVSAAAAQHALHETAAAAIVSGLW
jgi:hypothetical protein